MSCYVCTRPKTLLRERAYLLAYGGPDPQGPPWREAELWQNWTRIVENLMKLYEKLPKCDECPETATYVIPHGPFYCDEHAQGHPTATEVPWCKEVRALGPDV